MRLISNHSDCIKAQREPKDNNCAPSFRSAPSSTWLLEQDCAGRSYVRFIGLHGWSKAYYDQ